MSRQASHCNVIFVLPHEGGQQPYRVRSEIEAFERAISEADLSPVQSDGRGVNCRLLLGIIDKYVNASPGGWRHRPLSPGRAGAARLAVSGCGGSA